MMPNFECRNNKLVWLGKEFPYPNADWKGLLEQNPKGFVVCSCNFSGRSETFLLHALFNTSSGKIGFYARSLERNRFHKADLNGFPFGLLKGFKFLRILIIVEGFLDLKSISLVHPGALAMFGGGLSFVQTEFLEIAFRRGLFESVIFIYDQDSSCAGVKGSRMSVEKLRKRSIPAVRLITPLGAKDPGALYGNKDFARTLKSWVER